MQKTQKPSIHVNSTSNSSWFVVKHTKSLILNKDLFDVNFIMRTHSIWMHLPNTLWARSESHSFEIALKNYVIFNISHIHFKRNEFKREFNRICSKQKEQDIYKDSKSSFRLDDENFIWTLRIRFLIKIIGN